MSDTFLTNWTVYYDETAGPSSGYKQIKWTGSSGGTNTVNAVYSELMHLFNDPSQNTFNRTTPLKAITPNLYEIGKFDASDNEPWFIDPESIKHLTGGGLNSVGWTRIVGTNSGIVKVPYTFTSTNFASTDIGRKVVVATDLDEGVLLHFESSGTSGVMFVRPDSSTANDNFDNTPTSGASISVTGGTAVDCVMAGASSTGEMKWSNIFTIGSIIDDTRIYISQNNIEIPNIVDLSTDDIWWDDGHIDILILTTEQDVLKDFGNLTVYARQPGKSYSVSVSAAGSGGSIPVALSNINDVNDINGTRTASVTGSTSSFSIGELVTVTQAGPDKKVKVTANTGSPTTSFDYVILGDGVTDLSTSDALTGDIVGSNGTVSGSPTNKTGGVLSAHGMTANFSGPYSVNVNGGATDYSIQFDLNNNSLQLFYEWLKYLTSRGNTTSLGGIEGQQYIGIDTRIEYTTAANTDFLVGDKIRQAGTDVAEGFVVSFNNAPTSPATQKYIMVRDTTGTWGTSTDISNDDGSGSITGANVTAIENITPNQTSPFGSFAGGRFFGARGVIIINEAGADSNSYEVIDDAGNNKEEPIVVTLTLSGLQPNSEIEVFSEGTSTIIDGIENSGTTFSHQYTFVNDNVDIVIHHINFVHIRLSSVFRGSTNSTIPITQQAERVFSNPI